MRPQPRYQPGDLIGGRYLVGLPARMGGMGEVYLCLHSKTNYPYALKTFQQKYVTAAGLRKAFEEEVAHWVALERHPNIVRCDVMEILDNQPFMRLEWINGEPGKGSDLRGWLRHGALDLETALNFTIDIVRGLLWAQEKSPGITHRDLKPGNILVEQGSHAKITDFGLAAISSRAGLKIELGEEPREATAGRHSLQADGGIVGTPPYMAPEQWEGLAPDPRDDIYALGCILHELLSGEQAFELKHHSRSHGEAMKTYRELHQVGEIPALPEAIPAQVRDLTRHCLAKVRAERFPSAEALLDALTRGYTQTLNIPPREAPLPGEFTAVDYNNRGVTYIDLKRHEQAIADLNRAIALNPNYAAAYSNRGNSYNDLGQPQRAIEDYDRAIALNPNYAKAYSNRGNSYADLGQHQRAIADYDQAIELDPSLAQAYANRGLSCADLGQHQRAIEDYDRAIALEPSNAVAYNNRGLSYNKLTQLQRAMEDFNRAIELDPSFARAYSNRGTSYAALGQHQRAMEDFDRAIELDPSFAQAYSNRGTCYVDLGQHQQAITDFDRAIELDPQDAKAYSNRGHSYYTLGQHQRAMENYDRAIELDPSFAQAYLNRAVVLARTGQFDTAIAIAKKAHQLGHPEALEFIGVVQQKMSGSLPPTNPAQAAFEAFQRAGSPETMRQAVRQHPLLLEPGLINQIEEIFATQVPPKDRPAFERRLAWLKQIPKGK